MYPASANPVFDAWTPEKGGGALTLWEYGGHLYEDRWQSENVSFLERTLRPDSIETKLTAAVERLVGEPEHVVARRVAEDFAEQRPFVESRCVELPRILATTSAADTLFEWTK